MFEKIKQNIKQKKEREKENIAKKFMPDEQQALALFIMRADEYLESKKAINFTDACIILSEELRKKRNLRTKTKSINSEQHASELKKEVAEVQDKKFEKGADDIQKIFDDMAEDAKRHPNYSKKIGINNIQIIQNDDR